MARRVLSGSRSMASRPCVIRKFAAPARKMVETMRAAAAAEPERSVSFGGAPGSNSHRAMGEYAPDDLPLPCHGFNDAIDEVKTGAAARALIPIENSQHGRVSDIHFLLPESGLAIVAEHFLPIHHALMAVPGTAMDDLEAVYSHPQALGQSRKYLLERGLVPLSHADTAGAAAFVAERGEKQYGAIAPAIAAELYGLEILENRVEDAEDNMTRFVALARETLDPASLDPANAMTTFIFEVKNIPAALYKALGGFATNGVNMTKLESYQKGASFSASMFYADILGVPGDPAVDRAMEELAFHCRELRVLGSYAVARDRG